ncbi:ATP-binding cassette domain-containing protein [Paracrocinitomix mangrovi]|uniref:ATP-binding cassette domain-containing protein n=1 Tax=Paracrocinitomix mangrovi TaxID=2862509 RepID=UPI001C8DAB31|nr:ATP-binding cassette domain-containing protein [Paracrocinitomix mangrovi]UKN02663.1 ATP-binding cassette domain-containing protein [Paracrocinitomix mangrovi]
MQISFQNVLPTPLAEYQHGSESVWNNSFELTFPKKILLNASSGKGKSTFVNTLYGVRKDYSGSITLDGNYIANLTLDEWINLRRDKISVVFQDLQLFPELTVWENLQLKNELTNHKSEAEIELMLEQLGIGNKKNQLCKTLSLGQQQRVAIIRSLLQKFEVLLMDEPFSHLDEENARIALSLINEEADKNQGGYILTTLGSHHGFQYDQELKL